MKKFIALTLALTLAVSLAACDNKNEKLEIGGYSAEKIAADVYYVEGVKLESDSGDNISASEGARKVWDILKSDAELRTAAKDMNIYIWLRGMEGFAYEEDFYVYGIELAEKGSEDTMNLYNVALGYEGDLYVNQDNSGWEFYGSGD